MEPPVQNKPTFSLTSSLPLPFFFNLNLFFHLWMTSHTSQTLMKPPKSPDTSLVSPGVASRQRTRSEWPLRASMRCGQRKLTLWVWALKEDPSHQTLCSLQNGDALPGHGAPEPERAVVAAAGDQGVALGPVASDPNRGHALRVSCRDTARTRTLTQRGSLFL